MSTVFAAKAFGAPPCEDNVNYSTTRLRTMDDEEENWSELSGTTVSPNCWPEFGDIGGQSGLNICSTCFQGNLVVAWVAPVSPSVIKLTTSFDGTTWTPAIEPFSQADAKQVSLTAAPSSLGPISLSMAFLNQANQVIFGYSTNGTSWKRKTTSFTGTSVACCGFQNRVYIAYTKPTDNTVTVVYSDNQFLGWTTMLTPYSGSAVSLATFKNNLHLAFVDMNGRVNVVQYDGSWPTSWSSLRNDTPPTTTPGQQWSAANGCLSLSSDANRLYLAFSQLNQTVYVASTMDPDLDNWSNASPVPNTSSTLSVSITPWTPYQSSNNVYLLQIDSSNSNLIQIAPYYLMSISAVQVEIILEMVFPNVTSTQVTDDDYIPLNESVLEYLYTNYSNTGKLLGNMKYIPNNFASDSYATVMKSIVSKYSYGDYPDMTSPTYISYATGDVDAAYDFRWTSLGGLCGVIYAEDDTLPDDQQVRCFNFTIDINFLALDQNGNPTLNPNSMICFDPVTGTKVVPSNGAINGFYPFEIIY